jgi:hypothetical protein
MLSVLTTATADNSKPRHVELDLLNVSPGISHG